MGERPVFYLDLASPYSYLASARVDDLLGPEVVWCPILVGALHKHYRRVSWGATPELRAAGVTEIENRARDYAIGRFSWSVVARRCKSANPGGAVRATSPRSETTSLRSKRRHDSKLPAPGSAVGPSGSQRS
jgi:hypothetical protein